MRINPAEYLEQLESKINKLHNKIFDLESEGIEATLEKQELESLNNEFDTEFMRVHGEYLDLFQDYYYCTEDIQTMLDLDIQMVAKRMTSELDSIQFSKIMRRHIKACRREKSYDTLELLLYEKSINIDKKVFFSKSSLIKWLTTHVTTYNEIPIPSSLALDMIENRSLPSVLSTVNYMKVHCLKYDMQLKRAKRERLYFHMEFDNKRVLSRIPVNACWDSKIREINEL